MARRAIHYSDGSTVTNPVIQLWEDRHNERAGFVRAFWTASPDASTGSPVVGYCSPGGTYRTIRAAVLDTEYLAPGVPIYRNGRLLNPATADTSTR